MAPTNTRLLFSRLRLQLRSKARLQKYITDVVTHFKGKVYAWDVVNEAVTDNGSDMAAPYRDSRWYQAAGNSKDYIDWAFEAARAADPDAQSCF